MLWRAACGIIGLQSGGSFAAAITASNIASVSTPVFVL